MNEQIKLATEIAILFTAIISLYKVAKFRRGGSPRPSTQPPQKAGMTILDFLKDFAGMYIAMLLPIVFMIGFGFLMKVSTRVLSSDSSRQQKALTLPEIDKSKLQQEDASALLMFEAAAVLSEGRDRDKLLKRTVDYAIASRSLKVALEAAMWISSSGDRNKALLNIMRAAISIGMDDLAVRSVSGIDWQNDKVEAARELIEHLEQAHSKAREPASPDK